MSLLLSLWSSPSLAALPGPDATWEVLQDSDPRVECTTSAAGETFCRSTGVVSLPIAQVSNTLENMVKYQHLFASIVKIDALDPDTMHIVLDYPTGMADRDYVARYTRLTEGDARIYRWAPVEHAGAPPLEGVVRLTKMEGEWRLVPSGAGTQVTYVWHAEIAGTFPKWLLPAARLKAGNEAIKDIRSAATASAQP